MKIKKSTLDQLIRLTRKYARTSDVDILPAKNEVANKLSLQAFNTQKHWLGFNNILEPIVGVTPFSKGYTYQTVYDVLKLLGFEIESEDTNETNKHPT